MRLWLPVQLDFARRTGANKTVEAHWRLYYLAFTRNRGDGHAHFDQGELARMLGIDPRDIPKVIKRAVARDLVEPGSTARCVWLPRGHEHKAEGVEPARHYPCPHHQKKPRRRHLRTVEPKLTPVLRTVEPKPVAQLRTVEPKFTDVSAGQGVRPSSSITGPTDRLSPAVSVVTRGQLLLTAGRPPIACKAAWRAAA
jgi:hypothetical protein